MTAKRNGRCLCGLKVDLHYTDRYTNLRLSCEEAKRRHPRAKVRVISLATHLRMSGAVING